MKKNGQYVGVDEKYIPEDEKYVDNEINEEIRKNGLNVIKGIGIGYLVFFGIVTILVVSVFIIVFINMAKINNRVNDVFEQSNSVQNNINVQAFNGLFELYNGTQSGFFVEKLLDQIVTNNKTKPDHIITVIYNNTMTAVPDEITNLKQNFNSTTEYEVSLDYDTEGFINKITIK